MTTTTTTGTDTETPEGTETGAESAAEKPNTPGEGQNTGQAGDGDQGGNSEAAGYRRRLRDTEAERDTLAERVATLQRREIDRLAGERLAVPADLLSLGGVELADLLGEDGVPDAEKIKAAADQLVTDRPGLAAPKRPTGGMGQGRIGAPVKSGRASWAAALDKG